MEQEIDVGDAPKLWSRKGGGQSQRMGLLITKMCIIQLACSKSAFGKKVSRVYLAVEI